MIFSQFTKYPNLTYGFSGRRDGSMNVIFGKDNREKYFTSHALDPRRVVTAGLVHGSNVAEVSGREAGSVITGTDGLITNTADLYLAATAADCFLLYFYDPTTCVIGIAHAGWRGLLAGVIENLIAKLSLHFSVAPEDLLVCIAPGIRKCHFEISPADTGAFADYPDAILERNGKMFVDLPGIIQAKLGIAGIVKTHIEDSGLCTHCNEKEFFSFRRDKPERPQVHIGYIGLAKRVSY